jgi:multiple sugar transport system ATP-binding protein
MAEIVLDKVSKRYPDGSVAVNDVDITIADGEFIILVGPSGCGKSTTLNMIAGLEDISSGELRIAGDRVNEKAPKDRDIAMVFQSYALYPHMTVRENIAFPLTLAKMPKAEIAQKVDEAARILDLGQYLDRKPANLSGGQRQRVAMGRAIVRSPKAFLMDEPLSNLDAKLRVQTRTEIAQLQQRLGTTTVYVTHDQTEAMTLGDRVVVLRAGLVQQIGSPQELYNRPSNLFVAGFIGSPAMNFLPGRLTQNGIETAIGEVAVSDMRRVVENAEHARSNGEVLIGIRPEHFEDARLVDPLAQSKGATFTVQISVLESMGSDNYAHFTVEGGQSSAKALADIAADAGAQMGSGQLIARL